MESKGTRDTLEILVGLSKEESFVLFYRNQGESQTAIGSMMGVTADRVQQFSSACLGHFGLKGKRWAELREKTNNIMNQVAHPVKWQDWHWPTMELLALGKEVPAKPSPEPTVAQVPWRERLERIAQNRNYQIAATVVVGVILIMFFSFLFRDGNKPVPTAADPINTVVILPTDTPQPPIATDTPRPPTNTPLPTKIPTITLTPSITPTPTDTSTPTITPTPTPTEDVYFSQNFRETSNFDPRWNLLNSVSNNLIDGKFTGDWIILDTPDLRNFYIEVYGESTSYYQNGIGISPAFQDGGNFVAFYNPSDRQRWFYTISWEGHWVLDKFLGVGNNLHIILTVIDANMTVTINGTNFAPFLNNKIPFGKIAFRADPGAAIFSIKIIRLP